jgi:hypothetical protein
MENVHMHSDPDSVDEFHFYMGSDGILVSLRNMQDALIFMKKDLDSPMFAWFDGDMVLNFRGKSVPGERELDEIKTRVHLEALKLLRIRGTH